MLEEAEDSGVLMITIIFENDSQKKVFESKLEAIGICELFGCGFERDKLLLKANYYTKEIPKLDDVIIYLKTFAKTECDRYKYTLDPVKADTEIRKFYDYYLPRWVSSRKAFNWKSQGHNWIRGCITKLRSFQKQEKEKLFSQYNNMAKEEWKPLITKFIIENCKRNKIKYDIGAWEQRYLNEFAYKKYNLETPEGYYKAILCGKK